MQYMPAVHSYPVLAEDAQDHALHGQLDKTMRRTSQAPLEARSPLVHELWRLHHAEAEGTEGGMPWASAVGGRAQRSATPQGGTGSNDVSLP